MKKSRQVVLLITGSVLLTACNQQQQQPGWTTDATNVSTNGTVGGAPYGRTVVHHTAPIIYPWYNPRRYFSSDRDDTTVGSSGSSSRSGISSTSRSGSSSSASHSSTSRGGFGSHSSSSS